MKESAHAPGQPKDADLLRFFRAIAARDVALVSRMLDASPAMAAGAIRTAASRQEAQTYFLHDIRHYVYAGDTGLHMAAASYQRDVAQTLVANGARARTRNRRGAEPLHYAADGAPDGPAWDPSAQYQIVEYLIAVGADPNAGDDSGVAPLHRAVRTRCSAAVRALLDNGADQLLKNKSGSTPLTLPCRTRGVVSRDHTPRRTSSARLDPRTPADRLTSDRTAFSRPARPPYPNGGDG